jgi:Flp pilus assembly protein TadD
MYAKKTAGSGKTSTVSGRAKINAGDYKGAIKTLTAVIANNPDESINYRLRGNAYDNLEKRERAIEDWKKAAALGDTIIQSYLSFLGIEWE